MADFGVSLIIYSYTRFIHVLLFKFGVKGMFCIDINLVCKNKCLQYNALAVEVLFFKDKKSSKGFIYLIKKTVKR